ncbi:phage neck terminator protein [Enterococcus faecalis]
MTESYNYGLLANKLIEVVQKGTGCQLIEGGTAGPQPDKPFFSYEVISPYIPVTIDVTDNEVFELVVSIKCHTDSSIQALNLSEQLRKHLNGFSVKVDLQNSKIALVSTTQSKKRDNFISIDYERLAGFDARFRVQDSYVDNAVIIENIELQEENK